MPTTRDCLLGALRKMIGVAQSHQASTRLGLSEGGAWQETRVSLKSAMANVAIKRVGWLKTIERLVGCTVTTRPSTSMGQAVAIHSSQPSVRFLREPETTAT
eukprot:6360340-Lingulodinium_polyedra.AAC.1